MLKAGGQDAVIFLSRMFNVLFKKGIYPHDWARGNTEQVDNYRGYLYSVL